MRLRSADTFNRLIALLLAWLVPVLLCCGSWRLLLWLLSLLLVLVAVVVGRSELEPPYNYKSLSRRSELELELVHPPLARSTQSCASNSIPNSTPELERDPLEPPGARPATRAGIATRSEHATRGSWPDYWEHGRYYGLLASLLGTRTLLNSHYIDLFVVDAQLSDALRRRRARTAGVKRQGQARRDKETRGTRMRRNEENEEMNRGALQPTSDGIHDEINGSDATSSLKSYLVQDDLLGE